MLVHISSTVYIQWNDEGQASKKEDLMLFEIDSTRFQMLNVSEFDSRLPHERDSAQSAAGFGSLIEVHRFDQAARCLTERGSSIVFLIGPGINQQKRDLFLIGCHLILTHNLQFEEACLSLKRFPGFIDDKFSEWSLATGLRSFCCAKCMDWVCKSTPGTTRLDQVAQNDG